MIVELVGDMYKKYSLDLESCTVTDITKKDHKIYSPLSREYFEILSIISWSSKFAAEVAFANCLLAEIPPSL